MINEFLKRLTPDFCNIDEVYNELLAHYNPDNINTTELTFIQSVQFDNVERSENSKKLSMYLGKKSTRVNWYDIDYYNRYIEPKCFYAGSTQAFKSNQFDEVVIFLNENKKRYNYIYNKLENNDKIEFKNDFCDKLESLKSNQTVSKFKEVIVDLINQIEDDYLKYKVSLIIPQQPKAVNPETVKKELYNHIFKGNAFEVFEKYHSTKSLAENSKTDLNLLFQLFENDNLFVETVELKHYIRWLNEKYFYSLTELKKVAMKSKPNVQRTNNYNEYKKTTLKQP